MGVKRVYVEKKPEFAVQAKELRHEVKSYLGIKTVKNVRVLIRYDVENLSDATFERFGLKTLPIKLGLQTTRTL